MEKQISRRDFLLRCGGCALFCAGIDSFPQVSASRAQSLNLEKGFIGRKLSPYFTKLDGQRIRCDLCPHQCEADNGERGQCDVRENKDGQYYSLVYGNPCAVHSDPIEKKPFFHVLPKTRSFSIATAGCNFTCKFCQNWEISQTRPDDTYNYKLSPEKVVESALKYGCRSIASTYVEPTIFFEYMLDMGRLARKKGLLKVMHSNGYINPAPLKDLCENLNAACIDLKAFTDDYYRKITGGTLEPVLETLKLLRGSGIHTELVNLMVPTKNDDMKQVRAMCRWIRKELGPGTPLHFSRFYPQYKLKSLPPTSVATLEQARKTALDEGLHFVYIGNVPGHEGEHTYCPKCGKQIINRVGYHVKSLHLKDGKCEYCGEGIPGIWK